MNIRLSRAACERAYPPAQFGPAVEHIAVGKQYSAEGWTGETRPLFRFWAPVILRDIGTAVDETLVEAAQNLAHRGELVIGWTEDVYRVESPE